MTLGLYARLDSRDEGDATAGLPEFTPDCTDDVLAQATGTHGFPVLPSGLPKQARFPGPR